MATMKVSDWLSELDSHDIYDSTFAKADCLEKTGVEINWPEHSHQQTASAIKQRGLGGSLKVDAAGKMCYGWEMAEAAARQLLKQPLWSSGYFGRGRQFRAAVEALVEAGY